MGVPELKRYETDNVAVDGNLWKMKFTELENDLVSPIVVDENLSHVTLHNNDFTYATSVTTLNNWFMSVVADADKNIAICARIDCR